MRDLLVIGGGINGAGIARDAAGRGLTVTLVERADLAAHTSSASTKLIHGGLRYLEQYDFALVRKALIEREILLAAAPHIIWPMRFVLPHHNALRPAWLVRLGLFLYDHMGGRRILPPTKVLRRKDTDKLDTLKPAFRLAFEYSDCWVDDARLVVLNVLDAAARGADIRVRTACTGLSAADGVWQAQLDHNGQIETQAFRAVVNAAGGWVDDILGFAHTGEKATHLRLVKGSHIVVPRKHPGDHAFFFQNADGRIMFSIPYEDGAYTLIGTTDVAYEGARDRVEISEDEIAYMCAAASEYYIDPVTPDEVLWTYSGVRPLYDDHAENASKITRDYVLRRDVVFRAPLLSVFGGKITTYRGLAEHALHELRADFPQMGKPWTRSAALPGGDFPVDGMEALVAALRKAFAGAGVDLPDVHIRRIARAYGTRAHQIFASGGAGRVFAAGLTEAEARYLVATEFAREADDILWRRTKCGVHMSPAERAEFTAWFDANLRAAPADLRLPAET